MGQPWSAGDRTRGKDRPAASPQAALAPVSFPAPVHRHPHLNTLTASNTRHLLPVFCGAHSTASDAMCDGLRVRAKSTVMVNFVCQPEWALGA